MIVIVGHNSIWGKLRRLRSIYALFLERRLDQKNYFSLKKNQSNGFEKDIKDWQIRTKIYLFCFANEFSF